MISFLSGDFKKENGMPEITASILGQSKTPRFLDTSTALSLVTLRRESFILDSSSKSFLLSSTASIFPSEGNALRISRVIVPLPAPYSIIYLYSGLRCFRIALIACLELGITAPTSLNSFVAIFKNLECFIPHLSSNCSYSYFLKFRLAQKVVIIFFLVQDYIIRIKNKSL